MLCPRRLGKIERCELNDLFDFAVKACVVGSQVGSVLAIYSRCCRSVKHDVACGEKSRLVCQ